MQPSQTVFLRHTAVSRWRQSAGKADIIRPLDPNLDLALDDSLDVHHDQADYYQSADPTTARSPPRLLSWRFDVVHSAVWACPVLYFVVSDESGVPLTLDEMAAASPALGFKSNGSVFETVLSQTVSTRPTQRHARQDHPVTLTPVWFVHPCQTSVVMGELAPSMGECQSAELARQSPADQQLAAVRYLVLWLSVTSRLLGFIDLIDFNVLSHIGLSQTAQES
ncbi:hypothetical protein BC831DRAFT_398940 [Entophlyctis helioformis]|nr:hypothetical protein BC831DRAFT_407580 [Entophlyctis helioformis]KAI8927187.1 hypothetical protein BC831DRAFT_398940 [Entophlyctis helioformis]